MSSTIKNKKGYKGTILFKTSGKTDSQDWLTFDNNTTETGYTIYNNGLNINVADNNIVPDTIKLNFKTNEDNVDYTIQSTSSNTKTGETIRIYSADIHSRKASVIFSRSGVENPLQINVEQEPPHKLVPFSSKTSISEHVSTSLNRFPNVSSDTVPYSATSYNGFGAVYNYKPVFKTDTLLYYANDSASTSSSTSSSTGDTESIYSSSGDNFSWSVSANPSSATANIDKKGHITFSSLSMDATSGVTYLVNASYNDNNANILSPLSYVLIQKPNDAVNTYSAYTNVSGATILIKNSTGGTFTSLTANNKVTKGGYEFKVTPKNLLIDSKVTPKIIPLNFISNSGITSGDAGNYYYATFNAPKTLKGLYATENVNKKIGTTEYYIDTLPKSYELSSGSTFYVAVSSFKSNYAYLGNMSSSTYSDDNKEATITIPIVNNLETVDFTLSLPKGLSATTSEGQVIFFTKRSYLESAVTFTTKEGNKSCKLIIKGVPNLLQIIRGSSFEIDAHESGKHNVEYTLLSTNSEGNPDPNITIGYGYKVLSGTSQVDTMHAVDDFSISATTDTEDASIINLKFPISLDSNACAGDGTIIFENTSGSNAIINFKVINND